MTAYAAEWKAAKLKFENDTGVSKPTEIGKVLGKEYRKSTGIESALEDVDNAVPSNLLEPVSSRQLKNLEKATDELEKVGSKYLQLLEGCIDDEKNAIGGKAASAVYRDLKILRTSLEKIIANAQSDLAKAKACLEAVKEGVSKEYKVTYITIKTISEGIQKSAKQALLYAQGILKNPTAEVFNAAFDKAARDLTQNLGNIRKWTLPEEIHPEYQKKRMEAMQDDAKIYEVVLDLYHKVENCKRRTLPLLAQQGDTPLNADLARMANNPPRFPGGTDEQTVIAATKHFIAQVKEAVAIAQAMT